MSAVPSWGGTTNVQRNVVLQESGNPNRGSAENLVTRKVLESIRCSQLMQNTLKTILQSLLSGVLQDTSEGMRSRNSVPYSCNTLRRFSRTTGIQASHDEQNDHRGIVVHNLEVLDLNLGQVTSLL
jgi:hypothetical protein